MNFNKQFQKLTKDQIEYDVEKSIVYLSLRIIVGLIFVYHGINKFGNKTKLDNWKKFIQSQNLPSWMALTSAIVEVVIGMMLILGSYIKLSSIAGIAFMIVALYLGHRNDKHLPIYQLSIIFMLVILFFTGPGKFQLISYL